MDPLTDVRNSYYNNNNNNNDVKNSDTKYTYFIFILWTAATWSNCIIVPPLI